MEPEFEIVFVCNACIVEPEMDARALALFLRPCPVHGNRWHRRMVRQPDGRLMLWIDHYRAGRDGVSNID